MTTATKTDAQIRWAIRRDLDRIVQIERQSFEVPWTEDEFLDAMRQRNCIGMVAECGDQIVGYMVYELHANYLKLINFAVAPACHRQGVGTAMIDKLKTKLSQQRRQRIVAEVRETNLDAQLFFRSVEFVCTGIFGEHFDNGEAAYCFEYVIDF